jgi:hypothetical protein
MFVVRREAKAHDKAELGQRAHQTGPANHPKLLRVYKLLAPHPTNRLASASHPTQPAPSPSSRGSSPSHQRLPPLPPRRRWLSPRPSLPISRRLQICTRRVDGSLDPLPPQHWWLSPPTLPPHIVSAMRGGARRPLLHDVAMRRDAPSPGPGIGEVCEAPFSMVWGCVAAAPSPGAAATTFPRRGGFRSGGGSIPSTQQRPPPQARRWPPPQQHDHIRCLRLDPAPPHCFLQPP